MGREEINEGTRPGNETKPGEGTGPRGANGTKPGEGTGPRGEEQGQGERNRAKGRETIFCFVSKLELTIGSVCTEISLPGSNLAFSSSIRDSLFRSSRRNSWLEHFQTIVPFLKGLRST